MWFGSSPSCEKELPRRSRVFTPFDFKNVLRATTACTFSTSEPPKVVRDRQFLTLLTSKCASRHNGVHFFDIRTSKSGPRRSVFNTFDFKMCFAPQQRALFRHRNFQKWSDIGVFHILTSKCASRHNGMHFFDISIPKAIRFSVFCRFVLEMCFAPQRRALFHVLSGQLAPHPPL